MAEEKSSTISCKPLKPSHKLKWQNHRPTFSPTAHLQNQLNRHCNWISDATFWNFKPRMEKYGLGKATRPPPDNQERQIKVGATQRARPRAYRTSTADRGPRLSNYRRCVPASLGPTAQQSWHHRFDVSRFATRKFEPQVWVWYEYTSGDGN